MVAEGSMWVDIDCCMRYLALRKLVMSLRDAPSLAEAKWLESQFLREMNSF